MIRTRASGASLRVALALFLLFTTVVPVGARDVTIQIQASSPSTVTVNYPVAYPIAASNTGKSTLNSVVLSGEAPASFTYLGASSAACSAAVPVCNFGQIASGQPLPGVTFYYLPTAPGVFTFEATVTVNEGANDNSDGQSNAEDVFTSTVQTNVVPFSSDVITGHSYGSYKSFSTGLNTTTGNPHGSAVTVPAVAEVRVADLPPGSAPACPSVAPSCFGWATQLNVGFGATYPAGIEVTIRWDASQLPSGMTDRKLRIIHLFDGGGHELVSDACTYAGGVPTNLPCIKSAPQKQADKDIVATILLLRNGFVRGW